MNRQFKFRVWHKHSKQWCSAESFRIRRDGTIDSFDNEVVFQQFTGFKDKLGDEIYEGDILALTHEAGLHEVTWDSESAAFLIGGQYWPNDSLMILGNIFQNPELLAE